jgi:hypothetical protein
VATTTYEGFSLSHAAILNGTTGAESATLYSVRNGTIAVDSGNYDNTGDDVVKSEWFWINYANITIEAGFVTFATLAQLTGTSISSSGAAPNDYYALPLWTINSMNQPRAPLAVRVPSKDSLGNIRTLDFVFYNVAFQPFTFTGPSYKNGLTCSIVGRALMSTVNEIGQALPSNYPESIGRMISQPGAVTGAFNQEPFATAGI